MRVGIVVAIVVALGAGLFVWAFVGDDTEVRAAADTLVVPADWTLVTEEITPDYRVCLDGGSCPRFAVSGRRFAL